MFHWSGEAAEVVVLPDPSARTATNGRRDEWFSAGGRALTAQARSSGAEVTCGCGARLTGVRPSGTTLRSVQAVAGARGLRREAVVHDRGTREYGSAEDYEDSVRHT